MHEPLKYSVDAADRITSFMELMNMLDEHWTLQADKDKIDQCAQDM